MPIFEIETLEWFEAKATYTVEADTEAEARSLVVAGSVPYNSHEHPGDDDRFGEIISCIVLDANETFRSERGSSSSAAFVALLVIFMLLLFIGSGYISTAAIMSGK